MVALDTTNEIPAARTEQQRAFIPSRFGAHAIKIEKMYDSPVKDQTKHPGGMNLVTEGEIVGEGVKFKTYDMITGRTNAGHPRANILKRIATSAGLGEEYNNRSAIDTDELAEDMCSADHAYAWFEEDVRPSTKREGEKVVFTNFVSWLTPAEYEDLIRTGKASVPLSPTAKALRGNGQSRMASEPVESTADAVF